MARQRPGSRRRRRHLIHLAAARGVHPAPAGGAAHARRRPGGNGRAALRALRCHAARRHQRVSRHRNHHPRPPGDADPLPGQRALRAVHLDRLRAHLVAAAPFRPVAHADRQPAHADHPRRRYPGGRARRARQRPQPGGAVVRRRRDLGLRPSPGGAGRPRVLPQGLLLPRARGGGRRPPAGGVLQRQPSRGGEERHLRHLPRPRPVPHRLRRRAAGGRRLGTPRRDRGLVALRRGHGRHRARRHRPPLRRAARRRPGATAASARRWPSTGWTIICA